MGEVGGGGGEGGIHEGGWLLRRVEDVKKNVCLTRGPKRGEAQFMR